MDFLKSPLVAWQPLSDDFITLSMHKLLKNVELSIDFIVLSLNAVHDHDTVLVAAEVGYQFSGPCVPAAIFRQSNE